MPPASVASNQAGPHRPRIQQRPRGAWGLSGRSFLPWCPEAERSSPLGLDLTPQSKAVEFEDRIPFPHGLEGWGLQQERLGWRWPPFTVFVQTFGFESITHLKGFMRTP